MRKAKLCAFWRISRSRSLRAEFSQVRRMLMYMVRVAIATTAASAASILLKIRLLISRPRTCIPLRGWFLGRGLLRIGFDLLAQATNVDINRARGDEGHVAPHRIQHLIAGEHLSRM